MSFRTGDRARAHKIAGKRRVRRSALRLLRRVSTDAPAQHELVAVPPAAPKA